MKNQLKNYIKINKWDIGLIILLIIFFVPWGPTIIKILAIAGILMIISRKNVWAINIGLLLVWGIAIRYIFEFMNFDSYVWQEAFLKESNMLSKILSFYFIYLPKENFVFIIIVIMMILVFIGSYKIFKTPLPQKYEKYYQWKRINYGAKLLFPVIGYLIIMNTTISSFAQIYSKYYNDYYLKYALPHKNIYEDKCDQYGNRIYFIKERDEHGYLQIKEQVNLEYDYIEGTEDYKILPELIEVITYDKEGNKRSTLIEKGFAFNNDDDTIGGTRLYDEFHYFSAVTFFTVGYGDIVPVGNLIRKITTMEMMVGHILGIIFVPLILTIIQSLYKKLEDRNLHIRCKRSKIRRSVSQNYE